MADGYQSKYFSGEEIDEILYKAKAAEDGNYGLGEYYNKDEVDSKIGDGVPTKVSELENDSLYVSQKELNSETDTVTVSCENRTVVELYEMEQYGTVTISIEDDDVEYIVEASDMVSAEWQNEDGSGETVVAYVSSFTIDDLSDNHIALFIYNYHSENVSVTVTRVKRNKAVVANVIEGSIDAKHIKDGTIGKGKVDSSIITEDAVAATDTIHLSYGNTTTETAGLGLSLSKTIYPEDGVAQYIIEFETIPTAGIPLEVYTLDGTTHPFGAAKTYTIVLADFEDYGGVESIYFFDYVENNVTITKVYERKLIHADVKEGSIKAEHLAEEYYTRTEVDTIVGDVGKDATVSFSDGETMTVSNNTTYIAQEEISNLTISYPDTNFICSFQFTLAAEGDITISLPESKYIGGVPEFANGETWELSIKNGVVVGGKVE